MKVGDNSMKGKFFGILLSLCLISFTSCSNNTSKNRENINCDGNLTIFKEIETIENSLEITPLTSLDFTQFKSPMSSEDYVALESYFPIFNEELNFKFQNGWDAAKNRETNLNELRELSTLAKLRMFTIFDLDNDGVKEFILCFDNAGGQLIFHKENDNYFAIELPYRGFKMLQINGVYNSSGGAACSHYSKLSFENGEFVEQELGHACIYEDEICLANGNAVSEEEFEQ